jgi:hypothetical protein
MKLLSIQLPSNKPRHFRRLVENLVSTAADPKCFQIVVKIDIGDEPMQEAIAAIQRDIDVNMTVVLSPGFPSYFHTYIGLNECLEASDPQYYFCWHINDEILMETPHWDRMLERYVDFFPDRVFRLKVNRQKMFHNFFAMEETCLYADYPIVPRRWLDATDVWAPCHGPDVYQEGISIYLSQYGYHRNVPLHEVVVGGDEPGENLSAEKTLQRAQGTCPAWDTLMSSAVQEQMARSARRLQLLIMAHQQQFERFEVREEPWRRALVLLHRGRVNARVFYSVDHVALRLRQFDYIAGREWPWSLSGKPAAYRAAICVYRPLRRSGRVLLAITKVPLGLAIGVRWSALMASAIDPHWRSIQEERRDRWLFSTRQRVNVIAAGLRRRFLRGSPRSEAADRQRTRGPA